MTRLELGYSFRYIRFTCIEIELKLIWRLVHIYSVKLVTVE